MQTLSDGNPFGDRKLFESLDRMSSRAPADPRARMSGRSSSQEKNQTAPVVTAFPSRKGRNLVRGMIAALMLMAIGHVVHRSISHDSSTATLTRDDIGQNQKNQKADAPSFELIDSPGSLIWSRTNERHLPRPVQPPKHKVTHADSVHENRAKPLVVRGHVVIPAGMSEGSDVVLAEESDEAVAPAVQELAMQLVREARQSLAQGNIDEARRKALSARDLNATFGVLEDRPETILMEIDRRTAGRPSISAPARGAASGAMIPPISPEPDRVPAMTATPKGGVSPEIRIEPGVHRHPLPDTGMRLSFDFHAAPWDYVLTQFAAKMGLPLEMNLIPSGTLNYVDHHPYSRQETLNTLNVLLIEKGFTLIHRDGKLILKVQPSAISSQATMSQTAAESAAAPSGRVGLPVGLATTPKERSEALLADARFDLLQGRIEDARRKAATASNLNVTYGLFDDRPEAVLDELPKQPTTPTQSGPASPFPTASVPVPPDAAATPSFPPGQVVEKQMSFSFREASWEFVLKEYAREIGLPLDMKETPPGTFTHFDSRLFTPEETLGVLNQFLSQTGFRMVRENERLIVSRAKPMLRSLR